jgi:hypothetical protein
MNMTVALSASVSTAPPAGGEVDYILTVTNARPQPVHARLDIDRPEAYAVAGVEATNGYSCTQQSARISCDLYPLSATSTTVVTVRGKTTGNGPLKMTATLGALELDQQPVATTTATLELPAQLPPPPPPTTTTTPTTPVKPVVVAPPTIAGRAAVGRTLRARPAKWNTRPDRITYAWQRCAAGKCRSISHATTQAYTLGRADLAKKVRVLVTAAFGKRTVASASRALLVTKR